MSESEGSYLADIGMGELAEWEMDNAEREADVERELKRRQATREKTIKQRADRRRTLTDLITLGILTGTVEEHLAKLEQADNVAKQTMNVSTTKVGEKTSCPNCGHVFIKKSYNQVFCSNQKKPRKGRDCKTEWHNRVNNKVRPF